MKLTRIGNTGEERPALIDSDGNYRDLSLIIKDLMIYLYMIEHSGLLYFSLLFLS